jgi:hypothetical protein
VSATTQDAADAAVQAIADTDGQATVNTGDQVEADAKTTDAASAATQTEADAEVNNEDGLPETVRASMLATVLNVIFGMDHPLANVAGDGIMAESPQTVEAFVAASARVLTNAANMTEYAGTFGADDGKFPLRLQTFCIVCLEMGKSPLRDRVVDAMKLAVYETRKRLADREVGKPPRRRQQRPQ